MVLVKILGAIDALAALVFLSMTFGLAPYTQLILFCAGILFIKGLFILTGEPLSAIDLASALVLLVSIFITPSAIFLWTPAFLLMAKAVVSFF